MALAANVKQYFPPKNIAQMEADLSLLPLWWAEEGDAVLSEELGVWSEECVVAWSEGYQSLCERTGYEYVPCPWGWNKAIKERFRRFGVPERLLPSDEALEEIRRFASREFACEYIADLLAEAQKEGWGERLLGEEMRFVGIRNWELGIRNWPGGDKSEGQQSLIPNSQFLIIKSPWSSSGRGIFVAKTPLSETDLARCNKFLSSQGGFLVDRFYDKVLDFAMEFEVKADGTVDFLGYSVFEAAEDGKYGGNVVASQEELGKLIEEKFAELGVRSEELGVIIAFHKKAIAERMGGRYTGIVGIDMLVDRNGCLHPCVEINVRMNMGVVAMRLYERLGDVKEETVLTPERKHGFNAKVSQNRLLQLYFSS